MFRLRKARELDSRSSPSRTEGHSTPTSKPPTAERSSADRAENFLRRVDCDLESGGRLTRQGRFGRSLTEIHRPTLPTFPDRHPTAGALQRRTPRFQTGSPCGSASHSAPAAPHVARFLGHGRIAPRHARHFAPRPDHRRNTGVSPGSAASRLSASWPSVISPRSARDRDVPYGAFAMRRPPNAALLQREAHGAPRGALLTTPDPPARQRRLDGGNVNAAHCTTPSLRQHHPRPQVSSRDVSHSPTSGYCTTSSTNSCPLATLRREQPPPSMCRQRSSLQ